MTTRADIVVEARRWINTPFRHQGRTCGVGVDCVGLAIGVAHALGLSDYEQLDYEMMHDGTSLMAAITQNMSRVATPAPGLLGVFKWRKAPQHVGIFAEYQGRLTLIHAHGRLGKCSEHTFDSDWQRRFLSAWEFPGVG